MRRGYSDSDDPMAPFPPLQWLEYSVKVFNVGQLRRALARAKLAKSGEKEDQSAAFFDPDNPAAYKLRTQMAEECLEQLISWLKKGGNVGIHDATNSSRSRREALQKRIDREPGMKLLFLESVVSNNLGGSVNVTFAFSSISLSLSVYGSGSHRCQHCRQGLVR